LRRNALDTGVECPVVPGQIAKDAKAFGLNYERGSVAREDAIGDVLVSPSVAADVVWAIAAAHSLFVIRQDASVQTDSSVFFTSDRVAVRATLRVGFGFTYPLCSREDHEDLRGPEEPKGA
jgi:hypothetical protein